MSADLITLTLRVASLGRDAQNKRNEARAAQLRRNSDSVAAATPSQLRRSSAARSISSVAAASAASRTRRAE